MDVKIVSTSGDTQSLPMTAFKSLRTAQPTPEISWSFVYNVNTEIVRPTETGTGSVTQSNSMGVLQTGPSTNFSARIETVKLARYVPGVLVRFTAVFSTGIAGSTQLIGVGDNMNGLFFGFNGDAFGIIHRNNGVDTFIPRESWNYDPFDGTGPSGITLNPTAGNVYSINYQSFGFGALQFWIENPSTGEALLVHRIRYANTNTVPGLRTPALPLSAEVRNTSNNTNVTLMTSAAAAFIEGGFKSTTSTQNAAVATKTGITTEAAILNIRSKSTYQGQTNRVPVKLNLVSAAAEGTKPVGIRLLRNPTLTGATFTSVDVNSSVMELSTDAVYTVGSGRTICGFSLDRTGSETFFPEALEIFIPPGDTITLTATSANTAEITATLGWFEFF